MQISVLVLSVFSIFPISRVAGRNFHALIPTHHASDDGENCSTVGCASGCRTECTSFGSENNIVCSNGFTLSADRTSCVCSAPSTVCYGHCGSFPNGCPTAKRRMGPRASPRASPQPTHRFGLLSASVSLILEARALCGVDESVCGVFEGKRDSFECVNTQTSLESCGGCMIPPSSLDPSQPFSSGVDCSTLGGVLDVSCVAGKCAVTKCQRGFAISPDGTECLSYARLSTSPTRTIASAFGKADLTMSVVAALFATQTPTTAVAPASDPDVFYVPAHELPTIPQAPSHVSGNHIEPAIPMTEMTVPSTTPVLGEQESEIQVDVDLSMSIGGSV